MKKIQREVLLLEKFVRVRGWDLSIKRFEPVATPNLILLSAVNHNLPKVFPLSNNFTFYFPKLSLLNVKCVLTHIIAF